MRSQLFEGEEGGGGGVVRDTKTKASEHAYVCQLLSVDLALNVLNRLWKLRGIAVEFKNQKVGFVLYIDV